MESALIEPSVSQVDSGEQDVGALYWRFRQHADRQALEALVENLQGPAFRVARLICGSNALAEEAAQEAFLAVLSPKAAPPNSSETFRAWFMKVVVNRARMARRTEYRAARKKRALQEDAAKAGAGEHDGTSRSTRSAECQALLRCLDELDERWQTPLALYYMEGLPQRDVALALGVSQQCASERIRKGLALLRGRLAQAGVAALLPAGSAQALGPALQAAVEAPAAWTAKLKAQAASGELVRLAAGAAEQSRRLAAVTSFGYVPWLAAAALTVAAAGAWYASHSEKTPVPQAAPGPQEALPPPDERPCVAPSQAPGLLARWTFGQGPAKELEVVRGTWTWQAPRKSEPGCMRSRERVWVIPPLDLPAQPVRVTVRFAVNTKERFAWSILRTDGQQVLPRKLWSRHDAMIMPRPHFELHVYLVGPYVFDSLQDGPRSSAAQYQTDRGPICCSFVNMDVREIEIRTLDQEEFPAFLRDPEAALQALGVEPTETPPVPLRETE